MLTPGLALAWLATSLASKTQMLEPPPCTQSLRLISRQATARFSTDVIKTAVHVCDINSFTGLKCILLLYTRSSLQSENLLHCLQNTNSISQILQQWHRNISLSTKNLYLDILLAQYNASYLTFNVRACYFVRILGLLVIGLQRLDARFTISVKSFYCPLHVLQTSSMWVD